jgi:predicted metal-dependent hydrolase
VEKIPRRRGLTSQGAPGTLEASAVPPPSLSAEERVAFEKGLAQFDAGLFFECHDTLEELWAGVRGPSRDFFQGLIQVAVGFYHLGNHNRVGAKRLFGRALKRLAPYPGRYGGLDVGALRGSVEEWRRALGAEEDVSRWVPPRLSPGEMGE